MERAILAKQLIRAANENARRKLLAQNPSIADDRLADEIRKACYAAWTVEPIKAQRAASAMRCLLRLKTNDEIRASHSWVSGISDITKAKFESAIVNLNKAAEIFTKIGRASDAAQTQVAKLLALAMIGRYDEAIETGKAALKTFIREGDELAAGKIEMNLSNIVSRRSLHHEAEKYCKSARRRFIKAGENSWKTMAENGLANTYAELNDFQKAARYYAIALETSRSEKMLVTEAEIEASLGSLALLRGRYAEALNYLEISRQKYDELSLPHQSAIADLEIADIYSELNLGIEAAEIYERVTRSFRRLKLTAEEARARLHYGRTAATMENSLLAKSELRKALKLFEIEKNLSGQTATLLSLSKLAIENDQAEAPAYLAKASAIARKNENPRHKIHLKFLEGELLRTTGKYARAIKKLAEAHELAKKHGQLDAAQATLNSLGKIAVSQNETATAQSYYTKAIKIIEGMRSPLAAEEFSMAFFASKLEPFENLVQLLLDENKINDAFNMLERARSRALLDTMDDGSNGTSDISGKLHEQLKELRAELNFYYKRLDNASDEDAEKLRTDIIRIENNLADTNRRINSVTDSKSNSPRKSASFRLRDLQRQLGEFRTLIEFVEFGGNISAFLITKTKIKYFRDLTTTAEIMRLLEDLHFQFGALRYGSIQLEKFLDSLKVRANEFLKQLYDQLLKSIEKNILGDQLIIIPAGVLNYVPFHALFDGSKYVVESFETSYAPSAGVWSVVQQRPKRKIKNSLLMAYADERIPLVENEVREIKSILKRPTTLVGKDATFSGYIENAPKFDLVHLACHGKFRAENPMFSSLHLADGWITVRDICSQRLRASLVTLSACETGLNKIFAGEEILGLARGFLTAGANAIVVSLWAVNDAATRKLMKDFYTNLQLGHSIPASLRRAQIAFIERREHPFFWSPFAIIGK
ncbi:MAG: CHAT domain-containing protein [Pyrinomonadaceae bacterium]